MLVNELLLEAMRELPTGKNQDDAREIAQLLEKHCAEMIQVYQQTGGRPLFRGMKKILSTSHRKISSKNMFSTIRKNRNPVEMRTNQHKRLEKLFSEAGLKANRSNSIFCTANYGIASEWSNDVKVIFVKDGWEGTVFEGGKDDYSFYDLQEVDDIADLKKLNPTIVDQTNLPKIIKQEYSDILITGASYFAISFSNFGLLADVFKELEISTGWIANLSSKVN